MKFNPLAAGIAPSATLALNQKAKLMAKEGRSIVNLTAGEPDFLTPERIRIAATEAMNRGETHYTAVSGIEPLRAEIALQASKKYARDFTSKNVIVSSGAKQSLFNTMFALLQPGDEVIMFSPYWVSYADVVKMVGGVPVVLPTKLENGFQPDVSMLEKAIHSKTRLIILNTPSNPTGAVYSIETMMALERVLTKFPELMILTDDIYAALIYDSSTHYSFPSIPADRLIILDGVSKAYAMTGWRIGWAVAPEPLVKMMDNIQSQTTSNASAISQWASYEAIRGDQSDVESMRQEFLARRDWLSNYFTQHLPFRFYNPGGAFYFFPSCEGSLGKKTPSGKLMANDIDLSLYLLEECGVAVVPGSAFGAPGFIRLSFGAPLAELQKGAERLKEGFGGLSQ